ncbi:MAG: rRNA maturation RNase YbeY [Candidatus Ancillula sp.]|jgi:probable rRNA maturation factor|nr:rRNA maturation RNase YbeY [Candidatus Ancillula sp.]
MATEVINETDFKNIEEKDFYRLSSFIFDKMRVPANVDLNILFVDSEESANLHKEWMDLDGPTDVLSFPVDELRPGVINYKELLPEDADKILGDIVICPEIASIQAQKAGHTTHEEMLLLATHGILHLLGYDHVEPDEKREMFDLQRKLLVDFLAHNIPGLPKSN